MWLGRFFRLFFTLRLKLWKNSRLPNLMWLKKEKNQLRIIKNSEIFCGRYCISDSCEHEITRRDLRGRVVWPNILNATAAGHWLWIACHWKPLWTRTSFTHCREGSSFFFLHKKPSRRRRKEGEEGKGNSERKMMASYSKWNVTLKQNWLEEGAKSLYFENFWIDYLNVRSKRNWRRFNSDFWSRNNSTNMIMFQNEIVRTSYSYNIRLYVEFIKYLLFILMSSKDEWEDW